MTDHCKAIIDFIGCDCELFENEPSGEVIINRWNDLTAQGKREGFYPLLIVASDTLAETLEFIFDDDNVENTPEGIAAWRQRVITDAEGVDAAAFLSERLAEYTGMHEEDNILGQFRECDPCDAFFCHMKGNTPAAEIILAKIPAAHPWELAAWVPMGGFNDCPGPKEQVATFRYWHEKYGAVPGTVTYDIWELELTNPPKKDEEAEALAKEHFAFCYDIVMQAGPGWDNIRARASGLKNSTTWYFWWD